MPGIYLGRYLALHTTGLSMELTRGYGAGDSDSGHQRLPGKTCACNGVLQAGLTPKHYDGHFGDSPILLAIRLSRTTTLTPGILCMYLGTTEFSYNPPCRIGSLGSPASYFTNQDSLRPSFGVRTTDLDIWFRYSVVISVLILRFTTSTCRGCF
jgi:hypothetical protein